MRVAFLAAKRMTGRNVGLKDDKTLEIRPISIAQANAYVQLLHRHHGKKVGCRFAIGCYEKDTLHGVAICSNPVAREADDGRTLEVSRLCTDGTQNACSMLYGACARIARDMGFLKIQTYILESESGTSLKASGWKKEAEQVGCFSWKDTKCKRQYERNKKPVQLSMFEEKTPPRELKQRWSRIF
jgi:hypothetical protein